ncbi:hypothetical protein [Empedobacter brevis]|uniref:hypothetical protein n=1 Tax=Empedobacter brevis TaxID=247 RepID=UPI0028A0E915|nr:hypothetical protein [Empedobacter brevis]
MKKYFLQKKVNLTSEESKGKIKVEKLCELIKDHPYMEELQEAFDYDSIKDEFVCIDNIDILFNRMKFYLDNYKRYNIYAYTKDISVYEEVNNEDEKASDIVFDFEEYVLIDEIKNNLKAVSIYDSKNKYLDDYQMTKYANNLFKTGLGSWAKQNVDFFKQLARDNKQINKYQSFRLVEFKNQLFLRGITSSSQYYEYGVDFTFVVTMLILHKNMKLNKGVEYTIKSANLNESKLDLIIVEKMVKEVENFGVVSTAIQVSTNDLGDGALVFKNIINVGQIDNNGFFLFPRSTEAQKNEVRIVHNKKPNKVFPVLSNMDEILNTSDTFINELNDIRSLKNPDELRVKILHKIDNPKSSFKGIKRLSDLFKTKIDNEITSLKKLIEMCNKAEELEMDYDLKDKLRYIISDIILYGNTKK